jgi:diadenosine tetraphosphate (Ap4A) HIT family hydrolase
MKIYEDNDFFIEDEKSEIPWLKIFTQKEYKELSDLPPELRLKLFELSNIVELQMRSYFAPDKINIASFANMLPRVHLHIMARYKNDSYFPQPMWGEKQRNADLKLPSFDLFYKSLQTKLQQFTS